MDLIFPILIAAGFLAGLIDSVAGGGGLISLPALLAVGVPAQFALGTNKFQSMFGTSFALANFHRKAKVIWKIAIVGIPFSLIGSAVGAKLALLVSQEVLAKLIVILLPPVGIFIFISKALLKKKVGELKYNTKFWLITILTCAFIGLYDGFYGPGTGTFFILALVLFSNLPFVNASATAKTFNLASSVGAVIPFIAAGKVDYVYGIAMAVANIAGNIIGSHYAMKKGNEFVRNILFVSLMLLFVYLVGKYFL